MIKEFRQKAASLVVNFFTGTVKCDTDHQSRRYHAIISDWMIRFSAHTSAETANPFLWARHPQNCPFPWRSRPHLIHDSLVPCESHLLPIPNGISIGSAIFAQHFRVTNPQTDAQTCMCDIYCNRPLLCTESMRCGLPEPDLNKFAVNAANNIISLNLHKMMNS